MPEGYVMTQWGPVPAANHRPEEFEPGEREQFEEMFEAMKSVRSEMSLTEFIGLPEDVLLRRMLKAAWPLIKELREEEPSNAAP
jgi:hypothetical protein